MLDAKALEQVKEAIEDLYYFEFVVGKSVNIIHCNDINLTLVISLL